ncbi:MAG: hypothetical protein LUG89_06140 [Methanosphaera sp.]|nr:hypothetical protein [Methanosphaera sp.]
MLVDYKNYAKNIYKLIRYKNTLLTTITRRYKMERATIIALFIIIIMVVSSVSAFILYLV